MDVPTRLELEKIVDQLRQGLPEEQFSMAAGLITEAIILIERGVEGERQVIRAERELLDQQQRAVEAERRALSEDRKELEFARVAAGKQRESAAMQETAAQQKRKLEMTLQSKDGSN